VRIAVLEDDPTQADTVKQWLQEAGHEVSMYGLSRDLMRDNGRESFDLYLLDWMVPDLSGKDVLTWLRETRDMDVPVIFLTSQDSEADVSSILSAGADDYMIKPARRQELLSRITAVCRRVYAPRNGVEVIDAPPYRFEIGFTRALFQHAPIDLTDKEFELAVFLFNNIGRLISRGHLLESVWGRSAEVATRTIDTHISRVRSKLALRPENGYQLKAIYNFGYRLERIAG
jgi:DNA-binding response OmpR family regulator